MLKTITPFISARGNRTFKFLFLFILGIGVSVSPIFAQTNDSANDDKNSYPSYELGGLLQQLFTYDESSETPTGFSTRLARVGAKGEITDAISLNLIGGFTEAPNDDPQLVNAFIDFDIHPLLKVRTGQFLLPFGVEGPEPIPLNPAIDRSNSTKGINTFTIFRDVGVRLSGKQSIFKYAVALINGSGANQAEENAPKDILGRVGFDLTGDLEVGVSGHLGHYQPNLSIDNNENRYRAGVDATYHFDPLFIRAEYLFRQDNLPTGDSLDMNGGYLMAAYQIDDNIEAFGRYDYYNPDTSFEDNHLTTLTLGASYYFIGNNRLSVNYDFLNDRRNPDRGNQLLVQMQIFF